MNPVHEQIGLDKARAGMTLTDNLCDTAGNMLLSGGTILTDAALITLRRRKVGYLRVLPAAHAAADLETTREFQRQRLARLFRAAGNEGANGLLLRHILQYRLGKINE